MAAAIVTARQFDVVVVNFLNKNNAADQRVYELLDEKFKLFSGVFGASDEVLGAVESGVDFEKRIASIYQKCRTTQQIQFEFDQLQHELDSEITQGQHDAREKLLDNFDQEVVEKVRIQSAGLLDRFNERLWILTRYLLADYARFDGNQYSFYLTSNPFPGETIHSGPYRLGKSVEDANTYRVGHPLARRLLAQAMAQTLSPAEVVFDYSGGGKNIAALTPLIGKSGWLTCSRLAIQSLESEDALILAGVTDTQEPLDETACRRLFDLSGQENGSQLCRRRSGRCSPTRLPAGRPSSLRHWPPRTANGSTPRWTSSTVGPTTAGLPSRPNLRNSTRRSRKRRNPPAWPPTCPRNWNSSESCGAWRRSETRHGGPTTPPAGTSTGKRTPCSTKSVADWSRKPCAKRYSRCDGGLHEQNPEEKQTANLAKPSASQTPSHGDFDVVLGLIEAARTRAVAAVNTTLIDLYWSVGEFISLKIADDGWGKGTVESLAETIQRRYPGMTGYSARNLWRMRQFYEVYRDQPKLAPLVRELSWTHNLLIMSRCKRDDEREFYLRLCHGKGGENGNCNASFRGPCSSGPFFPRQNSHPW